MTKFVGSDALGRVRDKVKNTAAGSAGIQGVSVDLLQGYSELTLEVKALDGHVISEIPIRFLDPLQVDHFREEDGGIVLNEYATVELDTSSIGDRLKKTVHIYDDSLTRGTPPSSDTWNGALELTDVNGDSYGFFQAVSLKNGTEGIQFGSGRTISGSSKWNTVQMGYTSTGAADVQVGEPAAWRSAIGAHNASNLTTGTLPAARLPKATASALGGIKVGSGLAIDSDGVLSLDVESATGVTF